VGVTITNNQTKMGWLILFAHLDANAYNLEVQAFLHDHTVIMEDMEGILVLNS
jgi:hypothetical protein